MQHRRARRSRAPLAPASCRRAAVHTRFASLFRSFRARARALVVDDALMACLSLVEHHESIMLGAAAAAVVRASIRLGRLGVPAMPYVFNVHLWPIGRVSSQRDSCLYVGR